MFDLPAVHDLSRRNLLKGMLAVGAVGTLGGLTACGDTASPGENGGGTTGMMHYIANVLALESASRGLQEGMKQLGGEFKSTSFDGDQQKMMSQPQLFRSLGVTGVLSALVADGSLGQYAATLSKQKISYLNIGNRPQWSSPADPRFDGYFLGTMGASFAEETYVMANLLFRRGGGRGKAILLGGVKGGLSSDARMFGVLEALKKYPDIQVVATTYADWDTTKAQSEIAALLPAYPDVDYVVSMNDGMALGALAALKAARNTRALLMGADGDPTFLDAMATEERLVGTAAGVLTAVGAFAAAKIYDAAHGVKFNPLESFLNYDSLVIDTPAAAQALLEITSPDSPFPFDARKMSRHLQGDNWELQHKFQVADVESFDWGSKPGVNAAPRPNGFEWSADYQAALDAGGIKTLNDDWTNRLNDPYAGVRAKAETKTGVQGTFEVLGLTV
ncbi:sugar ABC transporter substrate-binding protein [Rhodococcus sp. NPDC057014]|uniref:sugar ABC transporter substrate-binding protein n=1 Tax=Rhodococcus sp. NPDC057014 TaxID=3346000 RepID=UPI003643EB10